MFKNIFSGKNILMWGLFTHDNLKSKITMKGQLSDAFSGIHLSDAGYDI